MRTTAAAKIIVLSLLAGCSEEDPAPSVTPAEIDAPEITPSETPEDAEDAEDATLAAEASDGGSTSLPSCADVGSAGTMAALTAGLVFYDDNDGWSGDDAKKGLTCNWVTEAAAELSTDLSEHGSLAVVIDIDTMYQLTKETAEVANMHYEDPRAEKLGGWVLARPDLDLADQLGVLSPMVIVGDISVGLAASGVLLTDAAPLADITNDSAIQAAIDIHALFN